MNKQVKKQTQALTEKKNKKKRSNATKKRKTIRDRAYEIVMLDNTLLGRSFNIFIQIFILFSLVIYSVGTLPNLPPLISKILTKIDHICYIVFTIEYFLRIYVVQKRLKYIFSFFGIIDLLAILPFIAGINIDLRALRIFRVFRILQLSKYNESLQRFGVTLKMIKPELVLFLIIAGIFIFISAAGIYYFEHEAQPEQFASIFHSLWWAIITLTTVGYGDVYPITMGGRVFTFLILLIGLGVITIPTGLIASALSSARDLENQEDIQEDMEEFQDNMEEQMEKIIKALEKNMNKRKNNE